MLKYSNINIYACSIFVLFVFVFRKNEMYALRKLIAGNSSLWKLSSDRQMDLEMDHA